MSQTHNSNITVMLNNATITRKLSVCLSIETGPRVPLWHMTYIQITILDMQICTSQSQNIYVYAILVERDRMHATQWMQ